METEPTEAAVDADDEVVNHAFKLYPLNVGKAKMKMLIM